VIAYIVTYLIIQSFTIPCPQPGPTVDKFGRVYENTMVTLQLCYATKMTPMEKKFTTFEEATAFIKDMREENSKAILGTDGHFVGIEMRGIKE